MPPLTLSHAPIISATHSAAFEAEGFRGWSEEECAQMLAREEYFGWVVEADEGVSPRLHDGIRMPSYDSMTAGSAFILLRRISGEEFEIISLATHPNHQRKGLAKQLIAHALKEFPDATFHLEVRETNTPARALYASLGFTKTGTRPDYYRDAKGDRVNAVMMARNPAA